MVTPQPTGDPRAQVGQLMYLAQLEACKNGCDCKACQLLRKATSAMSDAALAGDELIKAVVSSESVTIPDPQHPASQ